MKYVAEHNLPFKIHSLICLAAPYAGEAMSDELGRTTEDFVTDTLTLKKVQNKVAHIYIFHSKDDFVVPYSHAESYKKIFHKAELGTFEDKNHFLQEEFPELIAHIKELG